MDIKLVQIKRWYYEKNDEAVGPLSESELIDKIGVGEINKDTLVWMESMNDWSLASSVEQLREMFPPTPPPLPHKNKVLETPSSQIPFLANLPNVGKLESEEFQKTISNGFESENQIRPWVRYIARILDYSFFSLFIGFIIGIIYPEIAEINELVFGLIIIFIWVFVEPIFLSKFATTPGKFILKTKVLDSSKKNLTYYSALKRSFNVWFSGMGIGIPLISLITMVVAYTKLKNSGKTSWDENEGYIVEHKKIGILNSVIVIILIIGVILLMFYGQSVQ